MTALIIIAAVLILLYIPVTVEFSFLNKKFDLRVKYLIFTLFSFPIKKKAKKLKSVKKTKKGGNEDNEKNIPKEKTSAENSSDGAAEEDEDIDLEGDEPPKKKKLSERLGKLKRQAALIWQLCEKHLKKIIKNISADRVNINFIAAGEDAYSAALLYGKLSAAVWNAVAVTSAGNKVKYNRVRVTADFNSEEPVYDISARVKITPAVVAGNLIVAAFKLLVNLKKIRSAEETA